jgi:glycosyltransferase involved in cell wall biosynthesis
LAISPSRVSFSLASRTLYHASSMKILHIITRLIVGGAQENTLLTCEGLHQRGHDVTLLTGPSPGPEGTLMERARSSGYQVLLTPHLVRMPHPLHDPLAYREIKRLCRQLKPDIVHTHSSKAGILGRAAAWNSKTQDSRLKTPLVIHTIHGLPFHPYQNPLARNLWIALERYAARRCDAIICVADAMTRQALAAGVGAERGESLFTTIYSAMDTAPFLTPPTTRDEIRARLHIPQNAFVFGTIARLQPLKGHDDLLNHAHTLFEKVPDARLLWIGDGIFRERFEKIIREKGWTNRFTLTGLVPPTEVPRLLPAMDALVHPSYREGLARALPQALLAAIPIISYDCDGAAEVCLDPSTHPGGGATGYLVKTGDAQALCQAMIRLASTPPTARAMGQRGREHCRTRFAADTMVTAMESLYQRLCFRP